MVLGGYFGSRLMSNIREEKGYTYGIGSYNVTMPLASYWMIATDVNAEQSEATIEECMKAVSYTHLGKRNSDSEFNHTVVPSHNTTLNSPPLGTCSTW